MTKPQRANARALSKLGDLHTNGKAVPHPGTTVATPGSAMQANPLWCWSPIPTEIGRPLVVLHQIKLAGDPPMEALKAVRYSYEWENAWKYVIVRPPTKTVGFALKTFSNKRGLQVHPGVSRVMAITGHARSTVVEAIAELRWLGFLWRVSSGQGSNSQLADSYQLCLPRTLDHLPMVDAKTGKEPLFADLPMLAQQTALVLEVGGRFKKGGGSPGELGGSPGLPGVVVSVNQWWFAQRTTPTHLTNASTKSTRHHSDSAESAARTSSRGAGLDLDDPDACYDFVLAAFDEDLDPYEASTVDGMLCSGTHPKAIINTIAKMREMAA